MRLPNYSTEKYRLNVKAGIIKDTREFLLNKEKPEDIATPPLLDVEVRNLQQVTLCPTHLYPSVSSSSCQVTTGMPLSRPLL